MEAAKRHLRDQRSMIALVSGPASPPNHTPRLKHLHLRDHPCRLILQPSPLLHIVLLRILPSLILKVQIPQILVDDILPLPQIIHPRLIRLHKRILLRPEHKHEHSKRQHHTCDHAHVSTPSPAESVPAAHRHPHQALPRSPAQGFPRRPVHIRIRNPRPTVASRNTAIGAIHATLSNPPRIGAASTVAPYFAANQFRIEASGPPPSICACSSWIITGETGHPTGLHSSRICPHPHVQIISCPSFSYRAEGSAPSITTASRQTNPACIHRLIE